MRVLARVVVKKLSWQCQKALANRRRPNTPIVISHHVEDTGWQNLNVIFSDDLKSRARIRIAKASIKLEAEG